MPRSYPVIDLQATGYFPGPGRVVSQHACADEALAAGLATALAKVAASKGTALEFTGVLVEEDDEGTWFSGDTPGDCFLLVFVNELGRPQPPRGGECTVEMILQDLAARGLIVAVDEPGRAA